MGQNDPNLLETIVIVEEACVHYLIPSLPSFQKVYRKTHLFTASEKNPTNQICWECNDSYFL